ncbi:hypothetical protein TMO_a0428 (plasmid) [Tistrella mobilis KA081020-065]|uniref:Uncharacterized protein n=1 Tax=Tistrella mobilis (strain KA081020-065) TaxID=1110502 RepID=I3TSU3_TISMK|nr:hypothetical protein TMO_a0428 [Tistrella mobilis KA081020-065]
MHHTIAVVMMVANRESGHVIDVLPPFRHITRSGATPVRRRRSRQRPADLVGPQIWSRLFQTAARFNWI